MICPSCNTGRIDRATGKCAQCQYEPPALDADDVPPGEEIEAQVRKLVGDDYHLEGLIGRGGMSLVYLAREVELNRLVALKVLPYLLSMGSNTPERFHREAKIAASLEHPNIVPVYRVGTTSSFMWYSMKYIKGLSLAQMVDQRGPLEVDMLLELLSQVGSALTYAHRRGIVHRDVKPENVLVDGHGWVWVCDFGVAKAFGSMPLTQTGGTLGTPSYMSPEQCYGEQLDGRADQYALAILVYRSLSGALPFQADSVGEMIRKQCMDLPPRLGDVRPDLPPVVTEALLRAMSKQREERFRTVTEFIEALGGKVPISAVRESLGAAVQALPDDYPTEIMRTPTRLRARRAAKLGVVAAALITAGIALLPQLGRMPPGNGDAVAAPEAGVAAQGAALAPAETTVAEPPTVDRPPPVSERRERPVPPAPARLYVSTVPVVGRLYVNGTEMGHSYAVGLEVPAGRLRIRIEQDGYHTLDTTVIAAPGDSVALIRLVFKPVGGAGGGT
jgi:hypothetical protein